MSIFDKVLIYDVETTIYKHQIKNEHGLYNIKNKNGSALCSPQKLVMSGFKLRDDIHTLQFDVKEQTQSFFNKASLIVGFNIKFDLHWARRIGVDLSNIVIWDCQIAEFLLLKQAVRFPSLNSACKRYDIPSKLDVVATEYWNKGIDTDEVPTNIVREYLEGDLDRTERVFKQQVFLLKGIKL